MIRPFWGQPRDHRHDLIRKLFPALCKICKARR